MARKILKELTLKVSYKKELMTKEMTLLKVKL